MEPSSSGSSSSSSSSAKRQADFSLKIDNTGLSRVWKAVNTHAPFFRGERSEISIDEKLLVCIDDENVVFVDWKSGEVMGHLLDPEDENREIITCFTLIPRRNELVVSTKQGLLRHVDFSGLVARYNDKDIEEHAVNSEESSNKKEFEALVTTIRVWRGHQMPVLSMSCDPSGTLVATGSADRSVRVWDIEGGFCTHSFKDHKEIVNVVRFHPDPYRLLLFSLSADKTCKTFDLNGQACVASFCNHVSPPTDFSLSPDGYLMVTVGRDKVLNFYELRNNVHIKTVPVMEELSSACLLNVEDSASILSSVSGKKEKFSSPSDPGVNILITAGQGGLLRLFRVEMNGKDVSSFSCVPVTQVGPYDDVMERAEYSNELNSINAMHYLPLHHHIVSMTADYNIMSYQLAKGGKKKNLDIAEGRALWLHRHLIGCNDDILDMAVLNPSNDNDEGRKDTSDENSDHTHHRTKFAVVTNSAQVRLMDGSNFECASLNGHSDIVLAIDATPDGRWVITSSKDKSVRLWDSYSCKCAGIGAEHTEAVGSVCCSQRPSTYAAKVAFIVSGGGDKVLKKWTLAPDKLPDSTYYPSTLESTHSVRAHEKDINAVTVSPNDALIASGSQDKTIRLWNSTDLSLVAIMKGHKRGIWRICFSPIDKCIASCSGDRTVKLWSVSDHSCLRTFAGHSCSVLSLQFVKNGMQIISGSADGIMKLWTIRSGECEWTSDAHDEKIWSLKTISTTGQFVSGGCDGKLKVWSDITEHVEQERLANEEKKLLVEQMMSNDVKAKRYGKALHAALELGIANKALGILLCILEDENYEQKDQDNDEDVLEIQPLVHRLDEYTSTLSDQEIATMMVFLQEWNTNSRHCFVSQALLSSLINTVQIDRLRTIKEANECLKGLEVYSDRHFQRIDRLHQAAYVLEYISGLMNRVVGETMLDSTLSDFNNGVKTKMDDDDDSNKYEFNAGKQRFLMRGKKGIVKEDGEEALKIFDKKRSHVADDDDDDDEEEEEEEEAMQKKENSKKKAKVMGSSKISPTFITRKKKGNEKQYDKLSPGSTPKGRITRGMKTRK